MALPESAALNARGRRAAANVVCKFSLS